MVGLVGDNQEKQLVDEDWLGLWDEFCNHYDGGDGKVDSDAGTGIPKLRI